MMMVNAASEVGPTMAIKATSAQVDSRQMPISEIVGFPRVRVKFGHEEPKEFESVFAMTSKGSMDSDLLGLWFKEAVYPLYPDLTKENPVFFLTDGGPGRHHIPTLIDAAQRGLIVFPGYPMGTGYNQILDWLYGIFKNCFYSEMDRVEMERKSTGEDSNLSHEDLGRLIMGRPDAPIEERPFDMAFNEEKISRAWHDVGIVPFNRNSLHNNPRLRRVSDETNAAAAATDPKAGALQEAIQEHAKAVHTCQVMGFNTCALQPIAEQAPKKKKNNPKLAAAETSPLTYSVPMSDLEKKMLAVSKLNRVSAGTMYAAIGARAINGDAALGGLIMRERNAEIERRAAAAELRSGVIATARAADNILKSGKADEELSSSELKTLLSWKLGPRGGSSKFTTITARRVKWKEIKDAPSPEAPPDPHMEPLPWQEEYDDLLRRNKLPGASPAAAPTAAAEPHVTHHVEASGTMDVEGMTMEALDALVAVATAQKARLERQTRMDNESNVEVL